MSSKQKWLCKVLEVGFTLDTTVSLCYKFHTIDFFVLLSPIPTEISSGPEVMRHTPVTVSDI